MPLLTPSPTDLAIRQIELAESSAAYINDLLVESGENRLAKEGAGRQYGIEDGKVSIIHYFVDDPPSLPQIDEHVDL